MRGYSLLHSARRRVAGLWQSPQRLGIYVGKHALRAALAKGDGAATALPVIELQTPWFVGAPAPAAIAEMTAACARVAALAPAAEIHIALPEPVATYAVFDFDAIPASDAALADLVRWRFGKDLHFDEAAIVCRCQRLGRARERESVLGVALDRAWLGALQQALDAAGLVAAIIDTGARYRFNRFYPQWVRAGAEGGALAVEDDYWAILFWDAQGAIRFVRSRWRGGETRDDLVHEFARALQAYRGVGSERGLDLFFAGDASACSEWTAAIARETGERCEAAPGVSASPLAPATAAFNAAVSA